MVRYVFSRIPRAFGTGTKTDPSTQDEERETHDQAGFQDGSAYEPTEEHKAKFSHEVLAGGVAWEGTRLLEQHLRKEGTSSTPLSTVCLRRLTKPATGRQIDHPEAMAIGAGLLGGVVDKVAEGWGMNEYDKTRMHHQAKERMEDMYTDHYQNNQGADRYDPNLPPPPGMQGNY